ncbi:signal recognition particle-docking protein FtsY [Candidatus Woesearchaeota archaeon]|jgi:fused signal recognition particle receptor|nr:signal recognition particle-docking protein FtsY [Candidatus Woesearchaeota archaeon]
MFGFLKDKLKKAVSKLSKDIEEEGDDAVIETTEVSEKLDETTSDEKETIDTTSSKTDIKQPDESENELKDQEITTDDSTQTNTPTEKEKSEELPEEKKPEELSEEKIEEKKIEEQIIEKEESSDKEISDEKGLDNEPVLVDTAEKENEETPIETPKEKPKKKGFFGRLFGKKTDNIETEDVETDDTTDETKTDDLTQTDSKEDDLDDKFRKTADEVSEKLDDDISYDDKIAQEIEETDDSMKDYLSKDLEEEKEIKEKLQDLMDKTDAREKEEDEFSTDLDDIEKDDEGLSANELEDSDKKLDENMDDDLLVEEKEKIEIPDEKTTDVEEKTQKFSSALKDDEAAKLDLKEDDQADLEVAEEISEKKEKTGFFGKLKQKVAAKTLSESKFEDLFFELEITLLENNVAVEVIEKIKTDLKERLVDHKLNRFEIETIIMSTLKKSLNEILDFEPFDILEKVKHKKPFVITFVGVNGCGKTTTIAKLARFFQSQQLKPVLVAADTFRAAAIQQLEEHANRLGVKMIKHDYGSDPAAVAFDGIKYAESKGLDVVLIDTAGRLQSNINLMDEMKKIMRVANPDLKIFIGESITGNDCVEQAKKFNEAVEFDGIVLSKADVDEKGGAAISVSYVTGKPVLFIGTGQSYKDLELFSRTKIMKTLGF